MVLFASWANYPKQQKGPVRSSKNYKSCGWARGKDINERKHWIHSVKYTQNREVNHLFEYVLSIGCNKVDCLVSGFIDMPWPCCFAQVFCANMWRNCWPGSVWPKDQGEPSDIEGPQTYWEITMMRSSDCIGWRLEQELDWRIEWNFWFETEIYQNLNMRCFGQILCQKNCLNNLPEDYSISFELRRCPAPKKLSTQKWKIDGRMVFVHERSSQCTMASPPCSPK